LPYDSHGLSPMALVNSHATLPFGNQLRRFVLPNVEEPVVRRAAERCSWSSIQRRLADHDASWSRFLDVRQDEPAQLVPEGERRVGVH